MTDDGQTYGEAVDEWVNDCNETIAALRDLRQEVVDDNPPVVRWILAKRVDVEIHRLQQARDELEEKRRLMPFGLESAQNFVLLGGRDSDTEDDRDD